MSQGGFEQVTNGNSGHPVLFSPSFEADEIRLAKLYFRGVFNQQNAFVRRDELSECVQESRLTGARAAAYQQVAPLQDVVFEAIRECVSEGILSTPASANAGMNLPGRSIVVMSGVFQ